MEPVTSMVVFATNVQTLASAVTTITSSIGIIFASLIAGLGTISGICSAIVSVLPHPSEEGLYHKIHHVLNIIAFNIGNAKNAVTGVVPNPYEDQEEHEGHHHDH